MIAVGFFVSALHLLISLIFTMFSIVPLGFSLCIPLEFYSLPGKIMRNGMRQPHIIIIIKVRDGLFLVIPPFFIFIIFAASLISPDFIRQ